MKRILLAIILVFATAASIGAASPWEEVSRPKVQPTERAVNENDDFDVVIKDGWVYITTSKSIQIKIFTILGQQISSDTIAAGTHRMHIASRGIYILKAGSNTRRIVI